MAVLTSELAEIMTVRDQREKELKSLENDDDRDPNRLGDVKADLIALEADARALGNHIEKLALRKWQEADSAGRRAEQAEKLGAHTSQLAQALLISTTDEGGSVSPFGTSITVRASLLGHQRIQETLTELRENLAEQEGR